jgi:hypothetical protein
MMPLPPIAMMETRSHSAAALQDHLLRNFDRTDTSDLSIVFSAQGQRRQIAAHSLILSRSQKLWKLISDLEEPNRAVEIEPPNHFMTEIGLVAALRYLYGAPLWVPDSLFFELAQLSPEFSNNPPASYVMSQVLGYIASGHYLGLSEIVQAGLNCARRLQSWETVSTSLAFALDDGSAGAQTTWRFIPPAPETGMPMMVPQEEPVYGQANSHVLHETLNWLAFSFPPAFIFAPSATQLSELPRLPTVIENRPSQADPRLSLIQFGQISLEDTGHHDYLTLLISSILLSLPFTQLQFLFSHPALLSKPLDIVRVAEEVVVERENRRNLVLQAKRLKDGKNPALWDATQWKEEVVRERSQHGYPSFQLRRERVEEAQASSGD